MVIIALPLCLETEQSSPFLSCIIIIINLKLTDFGYLPLLILSKVKKE